MEIIIVASYIALIMTSYGCGNYFDKAYDAKLKRLGYISTTPELYEEEATLQSVMNVIKTLLICAIPIINLVPIFMLFGFESFSNSVIKDDSENGKLRKVSESELKDPGTGYLQKRIEELKEFQESIGKKNIPKTYSELSYDEKIDVLLHELQLAYEEKAVKEGIDLESVKPIIEPTPSTDSEARGLKKSLY